MTSDLRILRNAQPAMIASIPLLSIAAFRTAILDAVSNDWRVASLFGRDTGSSLELVVVLANDAAGQLASARAAVTDRYPALTPECPQVHLFEREIAEQFGVEPTGHPWLKPVRFASPLTGGERIASQLPGVTNFFRVEGEEVHEVAVGPVHAGVIEPGHFRFQCHGERVFHLEIALGYQHRGVERALIGGPDKRTIHYIETVAGDTTIGHTLAYCQAVEALSNAQPPARAQAIRGIALELERLANHTGDLGALSGDVAFLPTASYCGRIRGDFLNLTADLCGSRFGRGLLRPGGVTFDIAAEKIASLGKRLDAAARDAADAVSLLWDTPTVVDRFENTGVIEPETSEEIGLVGVAARACGRAMDVRHDFPAGVYRFAYLPVMTAHHGDVNSRALVRWLEMQQSVEFVREQLRGLPETAINATTGAGTSWSAGILPGGPPASSRQANPPLARDSIVVSMTEGWRGEICHVAITGGDGRFSRYKITDPSFHNWFGLALALRDGEISDFPLCNKSFNLSYCGHDL